MLPSSTPADRLRRPLAAPRDAVRAALANPALARLQVASLAAAAGEAAYLVALLVAAYATGGAGLVAAVAVIRSLPSVVLAPLLTAAAAGRLAPATQLTAVLVARVVVVGAMTAWATVEGGLVLLVVATGIDAVAAALIRPIRATLAPELARSPDELVACNVATSTGDSIAALLGPAIAAVLLAAGAPVLTFVAATGLEIAALVAASGIATAASGGHRPSSGARHGSVGAPRLGAAEPGPGLREILALRHARAVMAVLVCQRLVRGMLTVLVVALGLELLEAGDAGVGVLQAAVGLGGILGAFLGVALIGRSRLAPAFLGGVVAWGAGIAVPALAPSLTVATLALAVAGAGKIVLDVAGFSLIQRTVPNELRGRALGLLEGMVTAALTAGAVLASVLVDTVGPAGALAIAGAAPIAACVLAAPALRGIDAAAVVPERELRLLRAVPMLQPLQLATLERLAQGLRWRTIRAGDEVVQQGEAADDFYVVESGTVEAIVDDRPTRRMGPGDAFGEIGLLRGTPRTATVRALDSSVVAAISGDRFVAAVAGHGDSAAAAEALVRERLAAG